MKQAVLPEQHSNTRVVWVCSKRDESLCKLRPVYRRDINIIKFKACLQEGCKHFRSRISLRRLSLSKLRANHYQVQGLSIREMRVLSSPRSAYKRM